MTLQIAVPRETLDGERRVALTPDAVGKLVRDGFAVRIEAGAGTPGGWSDGEFESEGATIAPDAAATLDGADVVFKVNRPLPLPDGRHEVDLIPEGATLVAMLNPLGDADCIKRLVDRRIAAFAMELIPRISRAQSMDALSSMATVAGYKAVLIAADRLDKFFPMLMTAAGTVAPARVLVIGAGVAGLQAIATARRLGAVVSAFDTRPVVKEQVQSLGASFVEIEVATDGEAAGGYARELTAEEQARQQELLQDHIAKSDVVVTTALVPGRPAPRIISRETVERMRSGAVIVDLASEAGGNCELAEHDAVVVHDNGVIVVGPRNLPGQMPVHASQLYAKNVTNLFALLTRDGELHLDMEDEIVAGTIVCRDGELVHAMVRDRLGLQPAAVGAPADASQSPNGDGPSDSEGADA